MADNQRIFISLSNQRSTFCLTKYVTYSYFLALATYILYTQHGLSMMELLKPTKTDFSKIDNSIFFSFLNKYQSTGNLAGQKFVKSFRCFFGRFLKTPNFLLKIFDLYLPSTLEELRSAWPSLWCITIIS